MRLITIVLALMVGVVGMMMVAHHAQTALGESGQAVLAEFDTLPQSLTGGVVSTDTAGEYLVAGLATGCILLIACCALGLALLTIRAWRADLFRRLGRVAQPLRAVILATPMALTPAIPPDLVALSISRR